MHTIEQILFSKNLLEIQISNLKSGGEVSIEIQQFFNNTDRFKFLQQKIHLVHFEITRLSPVEINERGKLQEDLKKLYEEESSFKIHLLEYARLINKLEVSKSYPVQQLKNELLQGRLNDSDNSLNEKALEFAQQQLTTAVEEADGELTILYEKLAASAQEFLIKSQLTLLNIEIPDRHNKCRSFFEKSLAVSRRAKGYDYELSVILIEYGKFLDDNYDTERSISLHKEAVLTVKSLVEKQPAKHQVDLSICLGNLAVLYMKQNLPNDAEKTFEEAVAATRSFNDSDEYHQYALILCLSNLGELFHRKGQYDKAIEILSEGFEIAIKAHRKDFYSAIHGILFLTGNLAVVYTKKELFEKAKEKFETAIALAGAAMGDQLITLDENLVNLYCDAAELHNKLCEYETAKKLLTEVYQFNEQLHNFNSQVYLNQKAIILQQSIKVNIACNEFDTAKTELSEADSIYKSLSDKLPQRFLYKRIDFLTSAGNHFIQVKRTGDAEKYLQSALAIARQFTGTGFMLHTDQLVISLGNLATCYIKANDFTRSNEIQKEILKIIKETGDSSPVAISYIMQLSNIAESYRLQKMLPQAKELFKDVIDRYKRNVIDESGLRKEEYAQILSNLALVHWEMGMLKEGIEIAQEAVGIFRELCKGQLTAQDANLAIALNNTAAIFTHAESYKEAKDYLEEALLIGRKLAKKNPEVYLSNISEYLNNLADVNRTLDRMDEAELQFKEALEIRTNLSKTNPAIFIPLVAMTTLNIGNVYKNDPAKAEECYLKAFEMYSNLEKQNPGMYAVNAATAAMNLALLYSSTINKPEKALNYADISIRLASPFIPSMAYARKCVFTCELVKKDVKAPLSK